MRYLLLMRDTSGRGYKAVHDFETEPERHDFMLGRLMEADYSTDEIEDIIFRLESGQQWHDDDNRVEYEYV